MAITSKQNKIFKIPRKFYNLPKADRNHIIDDFEYYFYIAFNNFL